MKYNFFFPLLTTTVLATFIYDGMTLTNHIDPEAHYIYVDGFDHLTHPSVLLGVAIKNRSYR